MARARRDNHIRQKSSIAKPSKRTGKRSSTGDESRRIASQTKGARTSADDTDRPDWFRESVRQGRCGNRHDTPPAIKEITPETLEIAKQTANEAVDACANLRRTAELVERGPDEIWSLQCAIINAMNSALFALDYLAGGVRERLVLAHAQSQSFTMANVSRGTAHELACGIALEMVCSAWNAIVTVEKHPVPIRPSTLITFRQLPIRIHERGVKADSWPLFKKKHVRAVREAVLRFPEVDTEKLKSLIRWEYLHSLALLESSVNDRPSAPTSPAERAKAIGSTAELRNVQDAADALYAQVQAVRQIRKAKERLSFWLEDYCVLRDDHPLPRKWVRAVEGLLAGIAANGAILRAAIPDLKDGLTVAVSCAHVTETTGCGVLLKLAESIVNVHRMLTQPPEPTCDEKSLAALYKTAIANDVRRLYSDPMRGLAETMAMIQDHATGWSVEWPKLNRIIEAEISRAAARRSGVGGYIIGGQHSGKVNPLGSSSQTKSIEGSLHGGKRQQRATYGRFIFQKWLEFCARDAAPSEAVCKTEFVRFFNKTHANRGTWSGKGTIDVSKLNDHIRYFQVSNLTKTPRRNNPE